MLNLLVKKLETHKRMLVICRKATAESSEAAQGVVRHENAIKTLEAALQYTASYAPTWWAQSSFEGRIANVFNGGESYFYPCEADRAQTIVVPCFKRMIIKDGAGLVRLSGHL